MLLGSEVLEGGGLSRTDFLKSGRTSALTLTTQRESLFREV